jgi:hypothetical protein
MNLDLDSGRQKLPRKKKRKKEKNAKMLTFEKLQWSGGFSGAWKSF